MAQVISTNGRNALKVMLDLSQHEGRVSLGAIAERQGVSRKNLEQVMACLTRAGFVEGQRGKGGGYQLTKEPQSYTLGAILRVAQRRSLAPVECLDCCRGELCPKAATCATLPLWKELGSLIATYLDSKTLADLMPPQDASAAQALSSQDASASDALEDGSDLGPEDLDACCVSELSR